MILSQHTFGETTHPWPSCDYALYKNVLLCGNFAMKCYYDLDCTVFLNQNVDRVVYYILVSFLTLFTEKYRMYEP
jgi:hypothetical protein